MTSQPQQKPSSVAGNEAAANERFECRRCASLTTDLEGHTGYHKALDDLLDAMERMHTTTFHTLMVVFGFALLALLVAVFGAAS